MFVEVRPELEVAMDDMIADISGRFEGLSAEERARSIKTVLMAVSAVATSRDVSVDTPASLGMLFDFRCRSGGDGFSDPDAIAGILTAGEVELLPEADQEFAGNVLDAIAI